MVKLYTRQSLHTTTQLLQGSSGTTAKVWSNYTQDKVYILQHSYSNTPEELEQKFGQIIHKTKSTYYNTATPRLQGTRAKIWSNYTQDKVYILQHSYSKAPVKLQPNFGQIIHKTKSTYYNTATPRLHWNYSQNLVKLYTRQSLHTTTQLLLGSRELEPKFGQIIHKTKSTYYNTATPRLQGTRAKIWSNYTQDKVYILQHSYSKAPVELQPKFGQIIHKTKSTYYNTATPRLQWNYSQSLVKLYTRQSLHTTTQLLQGSSETTAKFWSNYTQDKVYILQHSYS